MALSFTVIETTITPPWAFGWFDLSRFKIDGLPEERSPGVDILREFLREAISQRSFCTSPDALLGAAVPVVHFKAAGGVGGVVAKAGVISPVHPLRRTQRWSRPTPPRT